MGERGRLGYLDGLRALAALLVVLVHVRATLPDARLPKGLGGVFDLGHYAVTVFIVISGFSLGLGWARYAGQPRWVRRFIVRRTWRIVPTYVLALALSVLLILTVVGDRTGTHWDVVLPLDWSGVAVHAALLQDFLPGGAPNHVLWSIAVEWHIYFLFPAILALSVRRGSSLSIGALAGGVYLLWATDLLGSTDFTVQYVACFALGVLGSRLSSPRWPSTLVATGLACAAPVLLFVLPGELPSTNALVDLPLATATACGLALMRADHLRPVVAALTVTPLPQLGLIAYSVYLVHAPAVQIVWQYMIHPLHLSDGAEFAGLLVVGTTVAVGVSWLFFLVAERPFLTPPVWPGRAADPRWHRPADRETT